MREKGARNQVTLKRFEKAYANQKDESGNLRVIEYIQKKANRNNPFSDHPSFEAKLADFCKGFEIKSLRKWAEKHGYVPLEGKGYSTSTPKDIIQFFSALAQSSLKGATSPAITLDSQIPTFACPHCGFMHFVKQVRCSKCKKKMDEAPETKKEPVVIPKKEETPNAPKRRGRPPKNKEVPLPKSEVKDPDAIPKKRGRKPKNVCEVPYEAPVVRATVSLDPECEKNILALMEKFDARLNKTENRVTNLEEGQDRILKTISRNAIVECKNPTPSEPEPEEPAKKEEDTYIDYIMSKYDLRSAFGENGEEEARDFVEQLQEVEDKAEVITLFAAAFGYASPDIEDDFANLNAEQIKKVIVGV